MAHSNRGKRFIFVSGAPRSGTTLIQNMLDSHPEVFGGPELLHIPDILKLRSVLHSSIDREWIDLICSHTDVDKAICSFIEGLLLPLADKNGCKYLSEKSPQNIVIFPELVRLFPEARFIHVIRDPRAIVASMLQVGKRAKEKNVRAQRFTRNLYSAINYVKICFDAGFTAAKSASSQVYTICYEQLVSDPEKKTKKLCKFLNLEWSPQMLRPGEFNHLGEKAATVKSNEIWYDKETYQSNPNTGSIRKWKATLTPTQQAAIIWAFKDHQELSRFGYDLSLNGPAKTRKIYYMNLARLSHLSYKASLHILSLVRRTLRKIS
jgi:hypothetical protein